MTQANIISVNPAKTTLGALHPEVTRKLASGFGRRQIEYRQSTMLSLLFPTGRSGFRLSVMLLLLRLTIGALIIWWGIVSLNADAGSGFGINGQTMAIAQLSAGALVTLGLGTRFLLPLPAILLLLAGVHSPSEYQLAIPFAALCAFISVAGPGWLSVDGLLNRAFTRMAKRNSRKRATITYKAFAQS